VRFPPNAAFDALSNSRLFTVTLIFGTSMRISVDILLEDCPTGTIVGVVQGHQFHVNCDNVAFLHSRTLSTRQKNAGKQEREPGVGSEDRPLVKPVRSDARVRNAKHPATALPAGNPGAPCRTLAEKQNTQNKYHHRDSPRPAKRQGGSLHSRRAMVGH